jgi:Saxitoxin biosynthesis operon protein SxtJ
VTLLRATRPCVGDSQRRVVDLTLHESLSRDDEVKRSSERRFGFTVAVFFLVLTALLRLRGSSAWPVPLGLVLAFLGLAAVAPNWLKLLNRLWVRFGLALHAIVSPVVLIILFFVVLTPISVIARLAGKDFLRLSFDREVISYWIERRPPGPRPESMRDQF